MPPAMRPERVTQNRVIARLTAATADGGHGFARLGDWSKREHNRCVEPALLRANLQQRGYSEAHVAQALQKLMAATDATGITPYQANLRTYQLLRYGVPVQLAAGAPHETVHLVDWAHPANNHFAVAEEVTLKGGHERRPDIVLYVNGMALVVIELKRSSVDVANGNLTRKRVKNVHLIVHPPEGRVTLVAPVSTRTEVARAYVISKLGWIRLQQRALREQAREAPRRYVERESHQLWGRNHLLTVKEVDAKPSVKLDHRRITLSVRPGSDAAKRAEVMHAWHRGLLHAAVPGMISRWEPRLGVQVEGYFLQRMKTKWGSCNHAAGNIRLNTELVKKPKDLVEYVVLHEMLHLLEPTHNERFVALLTRHWPQWQESRKELNALPLGSEAWSE